MDIFLRAKHWQLFVALIVLPIIIGIGIMVNMLMNILRDNHPDPTVVFSYIKFFWVPGIVYTAGKMCWQWAVAIRMQRLAPAGMEFKNTLFKIFFWFIIVFYPVMFVFMFSFVSSFNAAGHLAEPGQLVWFFAFFPLSFFNTFCMFYCYYYTAKTLKTVELQREVNFSDFILEAVLVWFFFIGVWILQPKVNNLIDNDGTSEPTMS